MQPDGQALAAAPHLRGRGPLPIGPHGRASSKAQRSGAEQA